jgi:hypothetical protein
MFKVAKEDTLNWKQKAKEAALPIMALFPPSSNKLFPKKHKDKLILTSVFASHCSVVSTYPNFLKKLFSDL